MSVFDFFDQKIPEIFEVFFFEFVFEVGKPAGMDVDFLSHLGSLYGEDKASQKNPGIFKA